MITARELAINFFGKRCVYKNSMYGYVAGVVGNYVILGFTDEQGCIKSFTKGAMQTISPNYKSYRFAEVKYLTIIE